MKTTGRLIPVLIIWTLLTGWSTGLRATDVAVLHVNDTIQPVSAEFIQEHLKRINEDKTANLVIIMLNTPGGLLTSTRDITSAIMSSRIPVSVYVHPTGSRAASAGFFILLSSDFPAMTPGTNAGAAHPVSAMPSFQQKKQEQEGTTPQKDVMGEKMEEDTAAFMRSIAEKRNRPIDVAERAVRESKAWSAAECLELGLIDLTAESVRDLISKLGELHPELDLGDPATVRITEHDYSFREQLLSKLASPELVYLLFLAGIIGIFIELKSPGVVFPGLFGAICLILFFYATRILPVNFAGILFIILAVILFALELKIVSYGFLTIGGIVSMIIGSAMLFKRDLPGLAISPWTIIILSLGFAALVILLVNLVIKAHMNRPMAGEEMLVGMEGTAAGDFDRKGKIFVNGEYWDAVTQDPVTRGQTVQVLEVRNMKLVVKPMKEEE